MANNVLQNFDWNQIRPYVLYLEPTTPFDSGIFFTFDSERELLEVIRTELLDFTCTDDDGREEMQKDIEGSLPDSIGLVDTSVLNNLNGCITGWTVGYIGTFNGCMNGQTKSERWFRENFRQLFELKGGDSPIAV